MLQNFRGYAAYWLLIDKIQLEGSNLQLTLTIDCIFQRNASDGGGIAKFYTHLIGGIAK